MSTFNQYLTEAAKSYDYKIKVAGELADGFASRMETALQKFELAKMSSGKKTPIQSVPLDFPALSNETVTIFDVTTNYPCSVIALKEYLADYMNINASMIVVRKPGEPTEEYQDNMEKATKSEYVNKLMDIEMKDAPKVNKDELTGDKYNMSLLKELLKSKSEIAYAEEKPENKGDKKLQDREDKGEPSPFTKPTNPHPDPKRK
jgi:hypothetical protein|tara:strand:- start:1339 stop:1950 length:612 start_codon:yes stop_codon:yes gene_type:complete